MLDKLYKLPRFLLVFILLASGVVFVLVNDPPHTLCKTQIEQFKKAEKGILFKDSLSVYKQPLMVRLIEQCKLSNAPGGCYDLFGRLRRLLRHFRLVSSDCTSQLSSLKEVKKILFGQLQIMTLLSWREEILAGKVSKFNWLSSADMTLFCRIKNKVILFYGRPLYSQFEQGVIKSLPGSEKQSPDFIKKKTIFSEPCSKYL